MQIRMINRILTSKICKITQNSGKLLPPPPPPPIFNINLTKLLKNVIMQVISHDDKILNMKPQK